MAFGLKNTAALVERRRGDRKSVAITALICRPDEDGLPIEIEIVSARGFLARTPHLYPKGTMLRVRFPSGRTPHVRVVWLEDDKMGCEFPEKIEISDLLAPAAAPDAVERAVRVLRSPAAGGTRE